MQKVRTVEGAVRALRIVNGVWQFTPIAAGVKGTIWEARDIDVPENHVLGSFTGDGQTCCIDRKFVKTDE
jgi:hypothetical protein